LAEAGSYGAARTGTWLWAVLVGAVLLVMKFILFAALVPTAWSERVRDTERAWLQDGLGPGTADAVIARAGALAPLAGLPLWSWVAVPLAGLIGIAVANAQKRL
jgi:hypothetical protein